ncbi:amino-acid permease BAT1 homolog [Humulus lupulus]|uniref:amino-acid permease BAT1 homolog n=1 Tax=Humulus lupulus TaxID=3486 RepID=UPI002B4160A3|nr:amino-acid permease BAT1 homolog [Humulus lupulus]
MLRETPSVAGIINPDAEGFQNLLIDPVKYCLSFAFSFSIISVLSGVLSFSVLVALSMAEICSSYLTSGGLYYWSAKLAGPKWSPFASWITGCTGGKTGGGYEASKYSVIAFHGGILLLHAITNSLPISWLSFFGKLAAAWNIVGVFVLIILIPSVATERASVKYVFTHFNTDNEQGIGNSVTPIFVLCNRRVSSHFSLIDVQEMDAIVSSFNAFETKEAGPLILTWAVFLCLISSLLGKEENNVLMEIGHIIYVRQAFEEKILQKL